MSAKQGSWDQHLVLHDRWPTNCCLCGSEAELSRARGEVLRMRQWVNDLQRGMFINCVYCGHRYGPDDQVPATMADVLKAHIERCPDHPMSALKRDLEELELVCARLSRELDEAKIRASVRDEWQRRAEAAEAAYGRLTDLPVRP